MKAFVLGLLFFVPVVLTAGMKESFQENQAKILAGEIRSCDDFCYGIAQAKSVSKSYAAKNSARRQAILLAQFDIVREKYLSKIVWPEALDAKQRRDCLNFLKNKILVSAGISKSLVVYENFENGVWTIVVGMPENQISISSNFSFDEAKKMILAEETLLGAQLPLATLIAVYKLEKPFPQPLDRSDWEDVLPYAKFSGKLKHLKNFAGLFPIGSATGTPNANYQNGMAAFRGNDLEKAYEYFVRAAENFDFTSLNMAGNVARRLEKYPEAVALLLHAHYLKPESPFPLVHLAWIAFAAEDRQLCEKYIRLIGEREQDAWTKSQLEALDLALNPPLEIVPAEILPAEQ